MATDGDEYDGGYKKVYGVEFKQPVSNNFGLNEESITDDPMYMFMALVGLVPFIGFVMSLTSLTIGYSSRHDNPFCIDEQLWKSGVIAMGLQAISVLLVLLFSLAV